MLFDQAKEDCTRNPKFERYWLEAKHKAQSEDGATPKKHKCLSRRMKTALYQLQTRHLLWNSLEARVVEKQIRKEKQNKHNGLVVFSLHIHCIPRLCIIYEMPPYFDSHYNATRMA
jgi:hypothetical protein